MQTIRLHYPDSLHALFHLAKHNMFAIKPKEERERERKAHTMMC